MMIDVLVIGTEPPCPRCDMVGRRVIEMAASRKHITVRHCSFDSLEAQALGKRLMCTLGTAHHVAKDAGIPVNWDAVSEVIHRNRPLAVKDFRPADAWTPELDALLKPCQAIAESLGYRMTPILVLNGEIKHHGSVPSHEQIAAWLRG
ncbi:hypothetical protein MASR1M90_06880 [Desulfovibrionales bacterium]